MQQQYTWFRAWTNFVQTVYGDFKETPYNSQQLNEIKPRKSPSGCYPVSPWS